MARHELDEETKAIFRAWLRGLLSIGLVGLVLIIANWSS